MGEVADSILHDSIPIMNVGVSDLIIRQVEPGCSCSVTAFDSLPFSSGQCRYIHYTIHFSDTGFFEKSFVFEANTDSVFHAIMVRGRYLPGK